MEMFIEYLDPYICVSKEGNLDFSYRFESHLTELKPWISISKILIQYFPKLEQKIIFLPNFKICIEL